MFINERNEIKDDNMDRKDFLIKTLAASVTCCGASTTLLGLSLKGESHSVPDGQKPKNWIYELEEKMIKGSETPAEFKAEKGKKWIKDLMDNMESILDFPTMKNLMEACGRSCYIDAFGIAPKEKPTLEEAERYIKFFESNGYEVKKGGNKTVIIYNWGRDHQNPQGLIMSDGYCMCPLVEDGPKDLSGSFCICSSGYVKEIFERSTGRTAHVEVLDSLKRGGKDCIFKIELFEE